MSYVKCPTCGQTFNRDKEENIMIGRRYYHVRCCTEDIIYREKIYIFLESVWGSCLRNKINAQINEFNQTDKITTKQVYDDLYYFYEILKSDSSKYQNTIKIVPFIHKDAQTYYYRLEKEEARKETVDKKLEDVNLMQIKIIHGTKMPKKQKEILYTKTEEDVLNL